MIADRGEKVPNICRSALTPPPATALLGVAALSYEGSTDSELVAAARAGERQAFVALVLKHRATVTALARRLLRDPQIAAEAVQEATLAAMVGIGRLRSGERFGAWYSGIVLNIGRRWLRSGARLDELPAELVDDAPGPGELVESLEVAERVRTAVSELAPGQREAVLAFYWRGLTHAEAAEELHVSSAAVKARLHQARVALRPRLSDYVGSEGGPVMPVSSRGDWVEVEVVEVRRSAADDPRRRLHAVVLAERGGKGQLPIYLGSSEAQSLAFSLEAAEMPRPMTYQLASSLVAASGGTVKMVRISRLVDHTFFAEVLVEGPTGTVMVDSRPSDALNLALVCGAPVFVAPDVFEDPEAQRHGDWSSFDDDQSQIVAEALELQRTTMATMLEERGGGPG